MHYSVIFNRLVDELVQRYIAKYPNDEEFKEHGIDDARLDVFVGSAMQNIVEVALEDNKTVEVACQELLDDKECLDFLFTIADGWVSRLLGTEE